MELKKTTELAVDDNAALVTYLPNCGGFNLNGAKGAITKITPTDMWGAPSDTLTTVFFTDYTVHTVHNSHSWLVR